MLVVFFESDSEESHNEFIDGLGFWGNSIEMMEIDSTRHIKGNLDIMGSFGTDNKEWLEYTGSDFNGDCQAIDYLISATTIYISPFQSYVFGLDTYPQYSSRQVTVGT